MPKKKAGEFGGPWTQQKLEALDRYLQAYLTVLKNRNFTKIYVDGFAGNGDISPTTLNDPQPRLIEPEPTKVIKSFKGSTRVALELENTFDRYIFIESNADNVKKLQDLKDEYPDRTIEIRRGDANIELKKWASQLAENDRALVFLDPYGMQVDWSTLETLAKTRKVDLWLLFPVGIAIQRLLGKRPPPDDWGRALTRTFGSDGWKDKFYFEDGGTLVSDLSPSVVGVATAESIVEYMIERLETIFAGVLPTPIVLKRKSHLMYTFCFAVSNPAGVAPAIRIATHIAKVMNDA